MRIKGKTKAQLRKKMEDLVARGIGAHKVAWIKYHLR